MTKRDSEIGDAIRRLGADSVYFLLHQGWSGTLPSSSRHFAACLAKYLPVVAVVPETGWPGRVSRLEPRIANCRILKVVPNRGPVLGTLAQIQTAQILDDMQRSGVKTPLLWLYDAGFAEAFAILPAQARVHHATENWFQRNDVAPDYIERLKFAASIADLNVAISNGCALPLLPLVERGRLIVIPNGCDFAVYGDDVPPDPAVAALRGRFRRVGVFAGRIDKRLDFDLIARTAEASPDTLLLFAGPVEPKATTTEKFSALLRRPNVRALGPVEPATLPAIYRAADFGFIPYVRDPYIAESAFPEQALEMAAAGLPVVCSMMRPLLALCPPLAVAETERDFLDAFARARRNHDMERALRRVAAAHDYNDQFASIVTRLATIKRKEGTRFAQLAACYPHVLVSEFHNLTRKSRYSLAVGGALRHWVYGPITRFVDRLPMPARDRAVRIKRVLLG